MLITLWIIIDTKRDIWPGLIPKRAMDETADCVRTSKGRDDPTGGPGFLELPMRANRQTRRALTLAATAALLTLTACAPAATASSSGTHAAPGGTRHASNGGPVVDNTATPGWRVVKRFGPDRRPMSGLITAVSADNAWTAWTGSISVVEHWTGGAWHPVTMPPKVAANV